ncbi:MAG TPA: SdpI family protein [Gemmatimonadaceae bacterium]|nr:SdpI family protein [Gemmatimonadaceae bacterium]
MRQIVALVAIAIAVIFSIAVYPRLPDLVAIHWGFSGQADGWAPKAWGAFLMPAIALGVFLILSFVTRLARRAAGEAPQVRATENVAAVVVSFLALVHIAMLGSALGWRIEVVRVIVLGIGAMLIFIGFQMTGIPRNPFFGIRTPWTLRSDAVWERTHRVGSRIMVICGVVLGLAALLPPRWSVGAILLTVFVMLVSTVGYSFWIRDVHRD